ncbi:outer membrane beta-barrel protein [Ferruginibacter sp.]|uniref:outer membrane beta-barrel protein n=1 Tax=Ferruginibacter sp. TaxID=1940288 RepID=UPI002658D325|nr:outer membrane beta-barrel protein [Ferruginibacter sp.]
MKIKLLLAVCLCTAVKLNAQTDSLSKHVDTLSNRIDTTPQPVIEPFSYGDFTWLNGNNRQKSALLDSKYFTGSMTVDVNYTQSNRHPIDNTVVGSTALARNRELQVSYIGIGGDFHYNNVRARFMTQFGTRSTVVPRNDLSQYKGQYDLATSYRYISEAYGGYHWDKWHGINLDAGIFMSYVGLMSYNNFENWGYQPSFTSDNTPWFFNGLRLQTFPTDRLKIELWLINGWQSYGMYNKMPGMGFQVKYAPKEYITMVSNGYFGKDAAGQPNRVRWHSDNSFLLRYYSNPKAKGVTKAAFSITGDLGFENGGGVSPFGSKDGTRPAQNFISAMAYHRLWFGERFAWTFGGGFMHNPGRYLVLLPTGDASALPNPANPTQTQGTHPFTANIGDKFDSWDASTTFDFMPNDFITWKFELVHRHANVPYFAGPGGVTSPDGYTTTPNTAGWAPDLVKSESRFVLAMIVRF